MTRKLLFLLVLMAFGCSPSSTPKANITKRTISQKSDDKKLYTEIKWYDFNEIAFFRAKLKNKVMVIYFFDDSCDFCKQMENITFNDRKVVKLMNENFVPIKVRGVDNPEAVDVLMGSPKFPGTVVLTPSGEHLLTVQGFINPQNYATVLNTVIEASKE